MLVSLLIHPVKPSVPSPLSPNSKSSIPVTKPLSLSYWPLWGKLLQLLERRYSPSTCLNSHVPRPWRQCFLHSHERKAASFAMPPCHGAEKTGGTTCSWILLLLPDYLFSLTHCEAMLPNETALYVSMTLLHAHFLSSTLKKYLWLFLWRESSTASWLLLSFFRSTSYFFLVFFVG